MGKHNVSIPLSSTCAVQTGSHQQPIDLIFLNEQPPISPNVVLTANDLCMRKVGSSARELSGNFLSLTNWHHRCCFLWLSAGS